jgi:hypothetical protein
MSPSRQTRRLRRSFAAVESRYVRDLGRREPSSSPAARPAAGPGYAATARLGAAHRGIHAEIAKGRARRVHPRAIVAVVATDLVAASDV